MIKPWKILESHTVFQHFWYTLRQDRVQLPDGSILDDYFVSVRRNVVIIFALTSDDTVLMVRQYKHGAQKILLELPGGYVNDGESPEDAARRELLEETGYRAEHWQLLARVYNDPTKDTNTIHLFLATQAVKTQEQNLDSSENIAVERFSAAQVHDFIRQGNIEVCGSITAIYLALDRLEKAFGVSPEGGRQQAKNRIPNLRY